MASKRAYCGAVLCLFCALLSVPASMHAQTAATATVSGTITDPTGAVVPGAEVVFLDTGTNVSRSQTTNAAGQYVFTNVSPGVYKLTVSMQGFRQAVVSNLKVEVAKSHLVNVTLEVGPVAETIEVSAGAGVSLQTTDATIGEVFAGEGLLRMPTTNRSAAALLLFQPLVAPGRGVGSGTGGQVAGARSDQSTFLIDGGDATSDEDGTRSYALDSGGRPEPAIPVPSESIEEFRVSTSNPNATFGGGAGGQVSLVTKRGTNRVHGSGYWYHQNDNLTANTWTRNRLGQADPEAKDNRYGFSAGGSIVKDYVFLYGHYEGRRFPRSADVLRLVPSDTLRQGVLRFRDRAGNIVSYPLGTSTLCGSGTTACDPRGLGMSPVVRSLWALLPTGNDPTQGDGLNHIGFRAPADNSLDSDFFVVRLDYNLTHKWNIFASYRFYRLDQPDLSQIDIAGLKFGQRGQPAPAASAPVQPRYLVWGLTGQITPRVTNDFRFAWLYNWWEWRRTAPFPQVAGTTGALQTANEHTFESDLIGAPIDIDTQSARGRTWAAKDKHITDNVTWVAGRHTVQFGGSFRSWDIHHRRDDKVVGAITALVYWADASNAVALTSVNRPRACTSTVTTNCLQTADQTRWDRLYAATLGMIDRANILVAFDKQFNPLPFGSQLVVNMNIHQGEVFAQDTWRIRPSLTLTYGLHWQVEMPPQERDGLQTLTIFRNSGGLWRFHDYLAARRQAAEQGKPFDPELAWTTIGRTGRKHLFDPDLNNFGPRVAAAWNPSFQNGFLGKLFGNHKTVIRGGYSLLYDRITAVNLVMASPITVGFGRTFQCIGPVRTGTCPASSDPNTAFRIGPTSGGWDGSTVPIPGVTKGSDPIILPRTPPFAEGISSQYDLPFQFGEHHGLDLTLQRELPGNMFLEVGYAGRLGRKLHVRADANSVPYFFRDPTSAQTLAQAFDAVAQQVRAGVKPFVGTPLAINPSFQVQAWFENLIGAGATRCLAFRRETAFINGNLTQVTALSNGIVQGCLPPTGFGARFAGLPLINLQVDRLRTLASGLRINYHGAFISLRKRMSHGLMYSLNYTFSRSYDSYSINQQSSETEVSAYNFDHHYGPSLWDRTHVFNSNWFYELPFGRGRRFSSGNWFDKLIGGWYSSGIYTANSGLPLCVRQSVGVWGGGSASIASCALPISAPNFGNSPHKGARGSGGIGTAADVNLFADPAAVFANFRRILIGQDGRSGRGALRGQPRWNLDFSLGKKTPLTESVQIVFSFDFLNAFNHMEFGDPATTALDLTRKTEFGVLRTQFSSPRSVQFGLRVEF